MDANEFISVATQLLAGGGEGRFRSAVSRAYYGAFHLAKQWLSDCGIIVRFDPLAHRNVHWCLANSKEQAVEDAASLLSTLREARNEADYELSSTRFTRREEAKAEVQRAIEILTLLGQYRTDEAKSVVAPRIRGYASTIGLLLEPMP